MLNLASLLVNDDAFDSAFNKTHNENKAMHKRPTGKDVVDHLDSLMKQSNKFFVDGFEHTYNSEDAVFFLREPTTVRQHRQACVGCTTPFFDDDKKQQVMVFCQFCGLPSC